MEEVLNVDDIIASLWRYEEHKQHHKQEQILSQTTIKVLLVESEKVLFREPALLELHSPMRVLGKIT